MGTPRVRYRAGGGHDHIHVLYAQGVLRRLCAGVWGRAGLGGDGLGVLTLLPGEEPQHILAAGAEETENDAEQTVDTPHATRSRRPPEHVAAPVERAVAAGALLGTPGAVLACAGAHGRGGCCEHRARDGGGARGAPDPRTPGLGRAGCGWRPESECA